MFKINIVRYFKLKVVLLKKRIFAVCRGETATKFQ
jgi:hypothetical protein